MNTVGALVGFLTETLECSQKVIARYTGVQESTLSRHANEDVESLLSKKTGCRLLRLCAVTANLNHQGISPKVMKAAIQENCFKDLHGVYDSVVSAIHTDKYDSSVLINISKLGLKAYLNKTLESIPSKPQKV